MQIPFRVSEVFSIQYLADGQTLITGCANGSVWFWGIEGPAENR